MMKKPIPFIGTLAAALAAGLLTSCLMQTAGSSVGTGNPSEIEVAFAGTGGPVALTGTVEIYAATQVPVPGFQPEPLVSYSVSGKQTAAVKADDFKTLPDSLWPKSSREGDSLFRFNVVVKGAAEGVVMQGLGYHRTKPGFLVPDALKHEATAKNAIGAVAQVAPLVDYSVALNPALIADFKDHFLFVAGTSFVAKNDSNKFSIKNLPKGSYQSSYLAVWQKDHIPQGSEDSVGVYNLTMPFNTEQQDTLDLNGSRERILLPPEFRGN